MLLQMVRIAGFDPAASCTPSTRSAWLSYVLIEMERSTGLEPARTTLARWRSTIELRARELVLKWNIRRDFTRIADWKAGCLISRQM